MFQMFDRVQDNDRPSFFKGPRSAKDKFYVLWKKCLVWARKKSLQSNLTRISITLFDALGEKFCATTTWKLIFLQTSSSIPSATATIRLSVASSDGKNWPRKGSPIDDTQPDLDVYDETDLTPFTTSYSRFRFPSRWFSFSFRQLLTLANR